MTNSHQVNRRTANRYTNAYNQHASKPCEAAFCLIGLPSFLLLQTQRTIQFPSSNKPVTNQRLRHCGPKPSSQTLASELFSSQPLPLPPKTGKALLFFCSSLCCPPHPRQPQQFKPLFLPMEWPNSGVSLCPCL